jgi:hypothetical protein
MSLPDIWFKLPIELPKMETFVILWNDRYNEPELVFIESYDLAVLSGEKYSQIYADVTEWCYAPMRIKQ